MALNIRPKDATAANLEIIQGATCCIEFFWQDTAGDPIDFTGQFVEFRSHIRRNRKDDTPLAYLSSTATTGDRIELDGADGKITLYPSPETTAKWGSSRGGQFFVYFDVELVASEGHTYSEDFQARYGAPATPTTEQEIYRLIQGPITVITEVTRD